MGVLSILNHAFVDQFLWLLPQKHFQQKQALFDTQSHNMRFSLSSQ